MTITRRQLDSPRPVRRGFTMVELIVTISIIAVLVALTVYAASSLVLRSETQRTQDALKLLESAAQEWSIASERQITFGDDGTPLGAVYEIKWGELELPNYFASVEDEAQFIGPLNQSEVDDLTRKFIRKIEKTPAVREMLARIDSKLLRKGRDEDTDPPDSPDWTLIRDAWDVPIRVILPGRTHDGAASDEMFDPDPGADADADQTIRTIHENAHGICLARKIFFVSAGPDGKFGDLHLDVATDDLDDEEREHIDMAADNIYSSPPSLERPAP